LGGYHVLQGLFDDRSLAVLTRILDTLFGLFTIFKKLRVVLDFADVLGGGDELHHFDLLPLEQDLKLKENLALLVFEDFRLLIIEDFGLLVFEDVFYCVAAHFEGHALVALELMQVLD
jgi:hypothetical protein